jgi:hypothetical protein
MSLTLIEMSLKRRVDAQRPQIMEASDSEILTTPSIKILQGGFVSMATSDPDAPRRHPAWHDGMDHPRRSMRPILPDAASVAPADGIAGAGRAKFIDKQTTGFAPRHPLDAFLSPRCVRDGPCHSPLATTSLLLVKPPASYGSLQILVVSLVPPANLRLTRIHCCSLCR